MCGLLGLRPIKHAHGFVVICFVAVMLSIHASDLSIQIRVATKAQGQLYDCVSGVITTMKDMDKMDCKLTTTKYKKTQIICIFPGMYLTH